MSILISILKFAGISAVITLLIALGLIVSQRPGKVLAPEGGLDFSEQLGRDVAPLEVRRLPLRDGFEASLRHLEGPEGAPLVILVHGSGWYGAQFDGLARELSAVAEVVAPDLRGHGVNPGRRGDLDYLGQFEDDLADIIAHFAKPGQKVVMAGHSSGGGLVVRFAGGAHGDLLDGAVLMAPFLQYDAPTAREASGGWAHVLTRRVIGLSMLNAARIRLLDHLTVIEFAMPRVVLDGPQGNAATTSYSWRLNNSFSPRRDWQGDVAALPPFLLIAGEADEAFRADQYEPTLSGISDKGQYLLLPGVGHLPVVDDPRSAKALVGFVEGIAAQ